MERNKLLLSLAFAGLALFSCEKEELNTNELNETANTRVVECPVVVGIAGGTHSVTLIAGQHIDAGTVDVEIVGENLTVTYNTDNGYELDEVHLWIGESLDDMPQTKKGSPKTGHFPYADSDLSGTSYTFTIPLDDLGGDPYVCDKTFYIVSHAVVGKDTGDGFKTETGWGNGEEITEKGWAMYFSVDVTCEIDCPF